MGAWGIGPFQNDDAQDWLQGFGSEHQVERIIRALAAVREDTSAPQCYEAIAAAEIVVIAQGWPDSRKTVPEEYAGLIEGAMPVKVTDDIIEAAAGAVEIILANSELKDIVDYDDDAATRLWYSTMRELRSKLKIASRGDA